MCLVKACKMNDQSQVRSYLNFGMSIDSLVKYDHGGEETPLIAATYGQSIEMVKFLLQNYKPNVNLAVGNGLTALKVASLSGHADIAAVLLEHGADVDLQDSNGWTALMMACQNGHVAVAEVLLAHGAKVNLRQIDDTTPLMIASKNGHHKLVKLLLELSAEVNLQMKDRLSANALLLASENGHAEVVEILLEYDAMIDVQNGDGASALIMASNFGYLKVVKLLAKHKANMNLQDKYGFSALIIASLSGHCEIGEALLNNGSLVDQQDKNGSSALINTCKNGHTKFAELLLKYGAQIDLQNDVGMSALLWSCANGHCETVELLLQYGARTDLEDFEQGSFALVHACNTAVIDILLKHGAQVNHVSSKGYTALMIASVMGDKEIVRFLLNRGALRDMKIRNDTASSLAIRKGNPEIADMLSGRVTLQESFRLLIPLAEHWKSIGTLLNMEKKVLDKIEMIPNRNKVDCLREMLSLYLDSTDPSPTWKSLASAVEPFDPQLAKSLENY